MLTTYVFIFYTACPVHGSRQLEPVPADYKQSADYTLDRSPLNHRARTEAANHSHMFTLSLSGYSTRTVCTKTRRMNHSTAVTRCKNTKSHPTKFVEVALKFEEVKKPSSSQKHQSTACLPVCLPG